jgi:hypothetical protein
MTEFFPLNTWWYFYPMTEHGVQVQGHALATSWSHARPPAGPGHFRITQVRAASQEKDPRPLEKEFYHLLNVVVVDLPVLLLLCILCSALPLALIYSHNYFLQAQHSR